VIKHVTVYQGRLGYSYWNIIWSGKFPQRAGKWRGHPCESNPEPLVFDREEQPVSDDPLGKFRARGYFASCFPEGDGISFQPPREDVTMEKVCSDITECFGWSTTAVASAPRPPFEFF